MKKIILTVAAVFALSFANAQDLKSKKGENYLPVAGEWAISFQAKPFIDFAGGVLGGHATSPASDSPVAGTFVGKKFTSDKTAYRVIANFGFGSNNYGSAQSNEPSQLSMVSTYDTHKVSSFDLSVGLGKEWRRGTTRLQGYYGADAMIGVSSSKWTVSDTNSPGQMTYTDGMGIKLGLNGFLGAEYFIFPKIAIGAQYNYGLNIKSQGASKTTMTGSPDETGVSRTSFNLGNVSSATMNITLHF
ncbi:hypothetical protein [Flavobacterium aciduliphilum]|uniref:Outer membrane protein with beta-barrel domain n=1 Tax=Flavobacterium aciduliphilum TaxID=1101402 RepID=A0A328YRJ0_9FLAO|nr:hypothetical protein [Flavobacterium aciduliphilum]RAR75753.1 hypothetical protein CLV55_101458 [Flavobacterium aciduliphilum]